MIITCYIQFAIWLRRFLTSTILPSNGRLLYKQEITTTNCLETPYSNRQVGIHHKWFQNKNWPWNINTHSTLTCKVTPSSLKMRLQVEHPFLKLPSECHQKILETESLKHQIQWIQGKRRVIFFCVKMCVATKQYCFFCHVSCWAFPQNKVLVYCSLSCELFEGIIFCKREDSTWGWTLMITHETSMGSLCPWMLSGGITRFFVASVL